MCANKNLNTPWYVPPSPYFHRQHNYKNEPCSYEVEEFIGTWFRLQSDQYLDKPSNRSRRVAKFIYSVNEKIIKPISDVSFFQSSSVNPLLGGINRIYERSEPVFINSPILKDILNQDCQHVCKVDPRKKWLITCHQFRIHCRPGEVGQPTPEGLHCDGHTYVFQHFIQRSSVVGGVSRVCSRSGTTLALVTLDTFLETIFLDDRELLHEVSPIYLASEFGNEGFRDMLVIDYDPLVS